MNIISLTHLKGICQTCNNVKKLCMENFEATVTKIVAWSHELRQILLAVYTLLIIVDWKYSKLVAKNTLTMSWYEE